MADTAETIGARRESDEDDDEQNSDRELQVAFERGWLKPGLNVAVAKKSRPRINNTAGLKSKLAEFSKKLALDWLERLDVTSELEVPVEAPSTSTGENGATPEDDFKREMAFYAQAQAAVREAVPKLRVLGVKTRRPDDFYAEMVKSDDHMKKVRERLLSIQQGKERSEAARKLREQRKYAVKVQKEVLAQRQKDKRKLMDAVKKHRKGMSDQLDQALASRNPKGARSSALSKKRAYKDEKFGFGGQKRKSKFNTATSSADMEGFKSAKHSKPSIAPRKGGKAQRPGKRRRQKEKSRKR